MTIKDSSREYADIINLPHPESKKHKRMSMRDRAAQFSPFAALTGHDAAIKETARRREIQDAYNQAHGIVPKTIIKSVRDLIEISSPTAERKGRTGVKMTKAEKEKEIARLEKQMKEAARMMEYEYAAILRDQIIELRGKD